MNNNKYMGYVGEKRIRSLDDDDEEASAKCARGLDDTQCFQFGDCPELSDITIRACGVDFQVHKLKLAEQSDYFRTLFQTLDPTIKVYEIPPGTHLLDSETARDCFDCIYDGDSRKFKFASWNLSQSKSNYLAGSLRHFKLLGALDGLGCAKLTEDHKKTMEIYGDFDWLLSGQLVEYSNRFHLPFMIEKRAKLLVSGPKSMPLIFDDGLARACAPIWHQEILQLRASLDKANDKLTKIESHMDSYRESLNTVRTSCGKSVNGRDCHCESDDEDHDLSNDLEDEDQYDANPHECLQEINSVL